MHWIIQTNLVGADDVTRLCQALDRLATPYSLVKLIPVVRQLDHVPAVEGAVFVYGSTFVHRAAYGHGWTPGYVGGDVSYPDLQQHYGAEMLNQDARDMRAGELVVASGAPLFVRPIDDGKLFTGQVFTDLQWNEQADALRKRMGTAWEDDIVMVAAPKMVHAEFRCFVIDGRVVAASSYKLGARVLYSREVDSDILDYAQAQVDRWCPNVGFVLDVARTPEGLKIVEINALSSAGFYAADLLPLVAAINEMAEREYVLGQALLQHKPQSSRM